jgi:hypothetical protein
MGLKSYNAAEVTVIFGTRALKGLAEGSFVTVSRTEDAFTMQVGADGEVTRSRTNNRSGSIEITLQQASEDNAYLQQQAIIDENTGAGILPVKIMDQSGSYVAAAAEAWIRKSADNEFARDSGERTWTIDCAQLDQIGGGN